MWTTRGCSSTVGTAIQRYLARRASTGTGITGGERIFDTLVAADVRKIFGIPGTHLKSLYIKLEERSNEISHVTMRHEQGAAFAAEGYARAKGDVAVALVMTGVGFTNAITPMAVALADSIPLLVISSEVPGFWSDRPARQFSHWVPHIGKLGAAVAKQGFEVTSIDEIEPTVEKALAIARYGRPGPVHINIPIDILNTPTEGPLKATTHGPPAKAALDQATQATLTQFATELAACERPLIIAGGGTIDSGKQLTKLAETLGAPVLSTVAGKGSIDERHGLAAGARLHTAAAREYLISRADALIFLGTQISPTDYWHFSQVSDIPLELDRFGSKALHVDFDPVSLEAGEVAKAGGSVVQADVAVVCEFLDGKLPGANKKSWNGEPEAAVTSAKELSDDSKAMTKSHSLDFASGGEGDLMCRVLQILRSKMPEDMPLVSDVCRIGYTALSLYPSYKPRTFIYPVGTTCLGNALPQAVGVATAHKGKGIVVIIGDGGLQFNIQELAVASELQLPMLIVLWNDAAYGEIRSITGRDFATTWSSPDFSKICAGYSIPHIRVDPKNVDVAFDSSTVAQCLQGKGGPVMLEVTCPSTHGA